MSKEFFEFERRYKAAIDRAPILNSSESSLLRLLIDSSVGEDESGKLDESFDKSIIVCCCVLFDLTGSLCIVL